VGNPKVSILTHLHYSTRLKNINLQKIYQNTSYLITKSDPLVSL